MARSFQQTIIFGRLGNDPELKYTQAGTAVVTLSLATDRRRKDADGEWIEETSWHRCKAFGNGAETLAKFAKKGELLFVEGRLDYWEATGDKGGKLQIAEVIVEHFVFGGGGPSSRAERDAEPAGGRPAQSRDRGAPRGQAPRGAPAAPTAFDDFVDDDIPF